MKIGSLQQLRGPERLFRIGQWVVAILFAYFLSQVGASIIADLPIISKSPTLEQFRDEAAEKVLRREMEPTQESVRQLDVQLDENSKALEKAKNDYDSAKESFDNWRSARGSTEQSSENPQVIARAKNLDKLLEAQQKIEEQGAALLSKKSALETQLTPKKEALQKLQEATQERFEKAQRTEALKVFSFRLAFVLPILLIAIWLFRKQRNGKQWPFVWGFIFFALFAFFFELVPYLPSFGGYIRYGVGALLTFFGGRALISALQQYLARKQQEQDAPQEERKQDIRYEKALDSIAKNQCPSCERTMPPVEGAHVDYCMHCGLKVFSTCSSCGLRHNSFYHFCPSCGVDAKKDAIDSKGVEPSPKSVLTGASQP